MKIRLLKALAIAIELGSPEVSSGGVSFEFLQAFGGLGIGRQVFDRPVDAVQDRNENYYVLDQGNNRVQVLDRRGNYLREWGRSGIGPRAFDTPSAILIDPKTEFLYVVDTLNYRLQVFDREGELVKTLPDKRPLTNPLGRLGSGKGEFNLPRDVALDRRGNIYVADTGNNRIQQFDPTGKFLAEWGKFSRRRAVELTTPMSLAYSDEGFGCLYVLNAPDCRVLKYDLEGILLREWPMHRRGEGARCGPSRIRIEPRKYTVYIADTENDRVLLFDRDGEPLGELGGGKPPFRKPGSVFISDLWGEQAVVADTGNNLIQTFRRE